MLGPVFFGKIPVLKLAYWMVKKDINWLDKANTEQEVIKMLMDVLLNSINELKSQSIYLHQRCCAFQQFDVF